MTSRRHRLVRDIADGNLDKIQRMGPTQGFGTPFFCAPALSMKETLSATLGPGPAEPQRRLRGEASFHRSGVPFSKGMGLFWVGGSVSGMDEKPRDSRQSAGRVRDYENRKPRGLQISRADITPHAEDAGRGARHVAPLRR